MAPQENGNKSETDSLFEETEGAETVYERPLMAFWNGKACAPSFSEVFDTQTFDTLLAATYVASAKEVSELARGFSHVQLIIGIPDRLKAAAMKEGAEFAAVDLILEADGGQTLLERIDDETRERALDGRLEIRTCKSGSLPIHSKIYLLEDSVTGAHRTVVGSANLTCAAFSQDGGNFEEALIFDDDEVIHQAFLERFRALVAHTNDFIDPALKARGRSKQSILLTTDEQLKMALDRTSDKGHMDVHVISGEPVTLAEVPAIQDSILPEGARAKQLNIVVSHLTTERDGKLQLNVPTPRRRRQMEKKVREQLTIESAVSGGNPFRHLVFDQEQKRFMLVQADGTLIPWSRRATDEEISENMRQIDAFVQNLCSHLVYADDAPRASAAVWEVLMYLFWSPATWMARDQIAAEQGGSARCVVPEFLLLAGTSHCGKSSTVAFGLRCMFGNETTGDIPLWSNMRKAIGPSRYLRGLLSDGSCSPVTLDEVSARFFTSGSENEGETIIKTLGNSLSGQHPACVLITNMNDDQVNAQTRKRLYSIAMGAEVSKTGEAACRHEFAAYMEQAQTTLFRDLLAQVEEDYLAGRQLYGEEDTLSYVRAAFRHYAKLAGVGGIPEPPADEYDRRGRVIWAQYLDNIPEAFHEDVAADRITIDMKPLVEKNAFGNTVISDPSVFLGDGLKVSEECSSRFLVVHRREFLGWIGRDKPKSLSERARTALAAFREAV